MAFPDGSFAPAKKGGDPFGPTKMGKGTKWMLVIYSWQEYRCRYTVDRSFAWLGHFRRLLIRWEHLFGVYRSFFVTGVLFLCVRRLCGS